MYDLSIVGADWLKAEVENLTDTIIHVSPSAFNEEHRYLPESVTPIPGYMRYDLVPFWREVVDCFDIDSPVREVAIKKGVQVAYTTAVLEAAAFYFMAHVKTLPLMYMTADKELAAARIENNFLPMLQQSGYGHIIRSSDAGNTRKTGSTKDHLQWEGGGYLVPFGAINPRKMRSYSVCVKLDDEVDGWPDTIGAKKEDPVATSDGRVSSYWARRKIARGSTPLLRGSSKIDKAYERGDKRKYFVLCKYCSFPQVLRWEVTNETTGLIGGVMWDLDHGSLVLESVRYVCPNCGGEHFEHDKERLFSPKHGAKWVPTGRAVEPNVRSYHLPAMYSPIGLQPWYKSVGMYLDGFDPEERKVRDIAKYQLFYNNVLGESFEVMGSKITFVQVSAHRRAVYRLGQIPNEYAAKWSGSAALLLTCQVDVHKAFLAVAVMGWCRESRPYVIEKFRLDALNDEEDSCESVNSSVWGKLRALIEEKEYTADDNKKYRIALTLIDASYANDTVVAFCSTYASGVYPILGRDRPSKNQKIKEFAEFKTVAGTVGYTVVVDHYKDRIAPVLRREWSEASGKQGPYHFNAPVDITDKDLKELTVETRREKTDENGNKTYYWHRPGGARNELWDLLVYGHAGVEILAYNLCINHFELEEIDWSKFWDYVEQEKLYFTD